MTASLRDRIEAWDGESVVVSHDAPTGTWIFIALHDTRHGPAVGGTRMRSYPSPADALEDALRLGRGMTYKWAGVGMSFGGGKAVLGIPGPLDDDTRGGVLDRYGRLLASLRGAFRTGVDLGTTPADMARVGRACDYVMGLTNGHPEDPGPYTALGVFVGIHAAAARVFGERSVADRSVLIQGLGDVGLPLAEMLSKAGASLFLTDIDQDAATAAAGRLAATIVPPDELFDTEVDVYAPCAIGATINPDTVDALRCRIVAGSANNQLLADADADALHERGILYAPDYIINAGGAIAFGRMAEGVRERDQLEREVSEIEGTLDRIFAEADEADESPLHAARRLAERFLETGPALVG